MVGGEQEMNDWDGWMLEISRCSLLQSSCGRPWTVKTATGGIGP